MDGGAGTQSSTDGDGGLGIHGWWMDAEVRRRRQEGFRRGWREVEEDGKGWSTLVPAALL
jgi:hypothetical protein